MKLGVNFLDKFGSTPLHWSLWFQEQESIQILVNNSADITLKDSSGMTPVDLVEYLGLDDSFKAILKSRETTLNKDNTCETGHIDDNAALSLVDESELEDDDESELEDDDKSEFEDEDFLESGGTMVDTDAWYEKIESKTSSLKKLISKILLSERMGLYFCFEENQAIQEVISQIIEKLTGYVSVSDPVLESTISLAGSVNEGTKVGWQNEFDYIWSLKFFNEHFVPIESPMHPEGYVKLQLPEGKPNMPGLERF